MKQVALIILFLTSFMISSLILPENNSTLNYTHVLFEWQQMENADEYQIQISDDISFSNISTDTMSQSLIYIEKNYIDWNSVYYWRVHALNNGNPIGEWSDIYLFSTSPKRSNAETVIYNNEEIQDGLTIFSSFFDYFSAIIDNEGKEIWNTENTNLVYYTNDNYGQLYGTQFSASEDELRGIKFSNDNEILWSETGDSYVHHDFFELPNGHYLGIGESYEDGPIPEDINPDVLFQFQMIGYPTYPTSNTFIFPWVGDEIVEWDEEGNVVWSWNTFEHLNWLEDYDLLGDLWLEAYQMGRHDWTHSNALWFDQEESAIYLSSRHLSRIIKIAYPSGDIVWQMGFNMPSGDVDCGHDLNFSFQHSLQILDNGNILILDNGNNSQDIYGTEHPTSRALEIAVNDTEDGCNATLVWSYTLPEDLFGFASGNVQKLDNGNYLVTTVGGGATSLEIKPTGQDSGDIVWQANYNLTLPSGAVYRAHKVEGLYPVAFSLILNQYNLLNNNILYPLGDNENTLTFKIWNDGEKTETFTYSIASLLDSEEIAPQEYAEITYNTEIGDTLLLDVTPLHREDLAKNLEIMVISETELSNDNILPFEYKIDNPYPNPFNPLININLYTPELTEIDLSIYNVTGEFVENLENGYISTGYHLYQWDASNMSSGTYFVKMKTKDFIKTKKILLIK